MSTITEGIDGIPDSLGFLVLNEDGAVLSQTAQARKKSVSGKSLIMLMEKQINITLGLWHMERSAAVLMTLLYNWCSIHYQAASSTASTFIAEKKLFATLTKAFLLESDGCHSTLKQFSLSNLVKLFKQFIHLRPECFLQICHLSILLGLRWVKQGNQQNAFTFLDYLLRNRALQKKQDPDSISHHFLLGVNQNPISDENAARVFRTMSLLLGLCHNLAGQYKECIEAIEENQPNDMEFYCKYLRANSLFHQNKPESALLALTNVISDIPILQARLYDLIGCCYEKLNKPQTALHHNRQAMEKCFTYKMPLYNTSVLYQQLGQHDVELESLNLLVTALEEGDEGKCPASISPSEEMIDINLSVGRYVVESISPDINLEVALYVFARRCLEMEQFEIASQKYLNLIKVLSGKKGPRRATPLMIKLPGIRTIFLETAYSLVMSGRYDDAVTICERILGRMTAINASKDMFFSQPSSIILPTGDSTGGSVHSSQSQGTSRKRKIQETSFECNQTLTQSAEVLGLHGDVVDGTQSSQAGPSNTDAILACIFKAHALVHLEQLEEASQCLSRAVDLVQDLSIHEEDDPCQSPKGKRRKMESSAIPCSLDPKTIGSDLSLLASKVYSMKAMILGEMGKVQDAIHFSRLCLQCVPDVEEYTFHHVRMLQQAGRQQEAYLTWLQHRKIDKRMDPLQIAKMLKSKSEQIREETRRPSPSPVSSVSRWKYSRLDVLCKDKECLDSLRRRKTF
ncbi:uncharacterized protein LOC135487402 isoform X2 [Lineus longissimus]|uniref:uncharacterized protein LOC135487402 isoform X2 n=1 Tax=Lineus longissimus TaxID=88925 RepID=UPI002B4D8B60